MSETLVKAAAGALAGAVIGWAGTALTLVGRVSAIEASQLRTEAQLANIAAALQGQTGGK